jgi:hypothetical protein
MLLRCCDEESIFLETLADHQYWRRFVPHSHPLKDLLLTAVAGLSGLLITGTAQAYPYAFVSNQITGLTVTTMTGTTPGRITPTAYSETISDTSAFGTSVSTTFSNGSTNPGTALSINQAFSGTSAPPPAGFVANGAGSFTGTRANAAISAGDATTGGVAVRNVAEGSGDSSSFGASNAGNKATIGLVVTGLGESVVLSFSNLYALAASTDAIGQTANASLQDTFSVIDTFGQIVAEYAPSELNMTIGSTNGTSTTNIGPTSAPFSFTTPILTLGESYTLSLTSSSSEDFFPGTPTSVQEPRSVALLGTGFIGLGILARRKKGLFRLRRQAAAT